MCSFITTAPHAKNCLLCQFKMLNQGAQRIRKSRLLKELLNNQFTLIHTQLTDINVPSQNPLTANRNTVSDNRSSNSSHSQYFIFTAIYSTVQCWCYHYHHHKYWEQIKQCQKAFSCKCSYKVLVETRASLVTWSSVKKQCSLCVTVVSSPYPRTRT